MSTRHKPPTTRRRARRAYTLVELLTAMGSSAILVAGTASTLYIAAGALDADGDGNRQTRVAAEVLDRMMSDVRHARRFTERAATAITFTVPDRDADGRDETIRYAWSGTPGDPLTYEYNGGVTTLAENVQAFNLTSVTRVLLSEVIEEEETPIGVVCEDPSEPQHVTGGYSLPLVPPSETMAGDLLLAVIAKDGMIHGLSAPEGSGWLPVYIGDSSFQVTLGVWWKIADGSDAGGASNYTFSWTTFPRGACGYVMRFTGHDPNIVSTPPPLSASNAYGPNPLATPVTTTIDNALVLRLAAIEGLDLPTGVTAEDQHTLIDPTNTGTSFSAVTAGAAHKQQATAGDSGQANFNLNAPHYYRTVTIAIQPEGS